MSELLESVKRLAESQESRRNVSYYSHSRSEVSCEADKFDFPALAKHLARLERVEAAAKEHVAKHEADWKRAVAKSYTKAYANEFWPTHGVIEEGVDALDAALSENPDVE